MSLTCALQGGGVTADQGSPLPVMGQSLGRDVTVALGSHEASVCDVIGGGDVRTPDGLCLSPATPLGHLRSRVSPTVVCQLADRLVGGASHSISHVTHSVQKSLLLVPPTCGSRPDHWPFSPVNVVQTGNQLLKQSDPHQQVVGGASNGGGARSQVHLKARKLVLAVVKLSGLRGLIGGEQHPIKACGRLVLWAGLRSEKGCIELSGQQGAMWSSDTWRLRQETESSLSSTNLTDPK